MNKLDDTFLNSWDVVLIDSVVALIVQIFYCWRIYLLQQSYILPAFISLVSLTQCGAGIATAVVAHKLGHLSLISTEVGEQTFKQHSTLVVPPYTNCLIAVLNNRRQTATGTVKDNSSSQETTGRNQYTRRSVMPSRSVVEPNDPVKIQIVRNVDLNVDTDMELGDMQAKNQKNSSWE
ncbi:hypothetical protein CVT25_007762 [Psilocybe cyanescens]|uniref:Uncharacterized protein n=1 Tax=Psilocybe cyanescens TaxID=93625 RepID=A0A409XHZ5_PSICY|nr:hypothetical protein CVT25_007762 [Psilocybe cyanescens]